MRLTVNNQDKLILLRTQERDLKAEEANLLQKRFDNAAEIHKIELKKATKKGMKLGAILTGIPAILVVIMLL